MSHACLQPSSPSSLPQPCPRLPALWLSNVRGYRQLGYFCYCIQSVAAMVEVNAWRRSSQVQLMAAKGREQWWLSLFSMSSGSTRALSVLFVRLETEFLWVALPVLELTGIPLPLSPECWDCRSSPPPPSVASS